MKKKSLDQQHIENKKGNGEKSTDFPQDEILPEKDAWKRFERAVDQVLKSPPQHRAAVKSVRGDKSKA